MRIDLSESFIAHLAEQGLNVTSPVEIDDDSYAQVWQQLRSHPVHASEPDDQLRERVVYHILWQDKGVPEKTSDPEVGSGVMAARRSVSILEEMRKQNQEIIPDLGKRIVDCIEGHSDLERDSLEKMQKAINAASENVVGWLHKMQEYQEHAQDAADTMRVAQLISAQDEASKTRKAIYGIGGAIILLLALLCLLSHPAHAQIDLIKLQNQGSTVKTVAAPFTINCSTNMTCSWSSGTFIITATSGGGGTTINVNGVAATTQNPVNFQSGTNITVSNPSAGNIKFDLSGTFNAATATSLAANPTDCSSGQYANAIAASGNLTCSQVAYSEISSTPQLAQTKAAVASNWLRSFDATTGLFTASRPTCSDISDAGSLCTSSANLVDTAAEVVGLFASGSCSGYLKSDGTCGTPAGGGTIASTSAVLKGDGSGNAVAATAGTDYVIPAGNVATATALAANPTDCSANQYATTIAANGNLTCSQVAYSQVSGTPTIPTDISGAKYIVQTADANLSAEQALGALGTGILKNTTTTGVLSIAVAADFPTLNQNTTGTAAGLSSTLAVGSGGTNLTSAADDNVMVGNGTTWQSKALPSCSNATTSKLLYDTSTNAFSCGTDQAGSGSGLADPGANGIVTRTALNTTSTAAYTDVTALWASGSCSGYLKSDGTCSAPSASAGGSDTQIQYNSSTTLAGDADFVWDATNNFLKIGQPTITTQAPLSIKGSVNGYLQANIQNASNGASASSDYVATADTGTDTTNYINMGINSSAYSDASYTSSGALDGYLYTNGGNLVLGTQSSSKVIKFHTGGTLSANIRAQISDSAVSTSYSGAGKVTLNGSSSGSASLQAGSAVTTYTWTLPTADSAGVLQSDGAGTISISAVKNYFQFATTTAPACTTGGGTTTFVGMNNSSTTETSVVRIIVPVAGTLKYLGAKIIANVPASETAAIKVSKNASTTGTPNCSIAAANSSCTDTSTSVAVSAGDLLSISVNCSGGTSALGAGVGIVLGIL